MARKLKTIGLALVAVFAMSAVVASTASAAKDTFTAEPGLAKLTVFQEPGAGKNKISVAGQPVECASVTGTASVSAVDFDDFSVIPAFGTCNYGVNPATIHLNGCIFTFNSTTHENAAKEKHATTTIVCLEGKHIEVTIPNINCIITFKKAGEPNGTQTTTNGYTITTVGTGTTRELTLHHTDTFKVSNDTLDKTKPDTLACNNVVGNGVYTGTTEITGENSAGEHVGVFDSLVL